MLQTIETRGSALHSKAGERDGHNENAVNKAALQNSSDAAHDSRAAAHHTTTETAA